VAAVFLKHFLGFFRFALQRSNGLSLHDGHDRLLCGGSEAAPGGAAKSVARSSAG
jgi:hypothetical protein